MSRELWDLSPAQERVMDAMVESRHVRQKVVARELGLSYRTVEHHLADVKRRMRVPSIGRALLDWDRMRQAEKRAQEAATP